MSDTILEAINRVAAFYHEETSYKLRGITLGRSEYDSLLHELEGKTDVVADTSDPYCGITIDGVQIDYEEDWKA